MTWFFIVSLILMAAFKILVASMPNSVVEKIIRHFELHPELDDTNASVTINGSTLKDTDKTEIIRQFNEALFLEKYYFPPQHEGIPVVINSKKGKRDVTFFLYNDEDHIDVIKQYKKKAVGYSLRSKDLQENPLFTQFTSKTVS
ncbi:YfmQ family protein [Bacillus manliponensis]|uniref:YfmQ family protein n=1 Tax=Bacillus manliponensis TaxID=574376 RepID=UPI003519341F